MVRSDAYGTGEWLLLRWGAQRGLLRHLSLQVARRLTQTLGPPVMICRGLDGFPG